MTKEQLEKLKEFVNNMPDKLAEGEYITIDDENSQLEKCFCVVGGMIKHLGKDDNFIYSLCGSIEDWEIGAYDEKVTLKELKENYGLTIDEFSELQKYNDWNFNYNHERAEGVKKYLLDLISKKELELSDNA